VPKKPRDLSEQELQMFRYLAEGKRDVDIAQIEGVKYSTFRQHVVRAVERVGAATRCHAIALLVKSGKL
jgi:DNA-binding CsgD family transcriptional regulator